MFGGIFFPDGRVLEETFEEYVQMVTVSIFVLFAVLLPFSYIFFTTHAINRKIRYLGKERPELTWKMIKEKFKRFRELWNWYLYHPTRFNSGSAHPLAPVGPEVNPDQILARRYAHHSCACPGVVRGCSW